MQVKLRTDTGSEGVLFAQGRTHKGLASPPGILCIIFAILLLDNPLEEYSSVFRYRYCLRRSTDR